MWRQTNTRKGERDTRRQIKREGVLCIFVNRQDTRGQKRANIAGKNKSSLRPTLDGITATRVRLPSLLGDRVASKHPTFADLRLLLFSEKDKREQ